MSSIVVAGDTSGTITIAAPAVAGSGTLTLPVATDTLVGKATTDTLTNKSIAATQLTGVVAVANGGTGVITSTGTGATVLNTNPTFSGDAITLPVGTTAQRPASPAAGMQRINTTTSFSEYYNGTNWISVVGSNPSLTQKAIFGYGNNGSYLPITNLVSNTGVVATDTTSVGTARQLLAAAGYGTDKAIFGYGTNGSYLPITNLVSNTGVVATDTTVVGTARNQLAAAGYGTDKAIFGYGYNGAVVSMTNLVSNTGVVATDTTGVGTARKQMTAAG